MKTILILVALIISGCSPSPQKKGIAKENTIKEMKSYYYTYYLIKYLILPRSIILGFFI